MQYALGVLFSLILDQPVLRAIAVTVVPALLLLLWVRKKDRLEPESPALVWSLVGLGCAATLGAWLAELGGLTLAYTAFGDTSLFARIVKWFLVVGLCEEGLKYLAMRLRTWRNPEFNCLFDGMVYAVAVSAGFALTENLIYLFRYGASAVLLRAVTSIPAHISFAVFMGLFYSAARKFALHGNAPRARHFNALAVIVPMLIHGLYDFIASSADGTPSLLVFAAFVLVLFITAWRLVKKLSSADESWFTSVSGGR